ncbi:MAG: SH3 domain-containing protein [Chloroflexi bacterium]|uniref:SH3 domain-containing protein n=1 Tax=Candidatus Flexifilum breve TaxID=3140694 RepID=UPI003135DFC9|nr:SH3 domain-containing protein [Chloroflexota bacterium]
MFTKTFLVLLIVTVLASAGGVTSAESTTAPCPLAPRSRLHVGAEAVVAPGIDLLNLRALPARTTGVHGRLFAGTRLTVIAGPSCNGSYNWWRIEAPDGTRGWVAEGTWAEYWLNPADQAERVVNPVEWTCGVGLGSRRCLMP